MALSYKRQAFVNAYLSCGLNATEAARQAGYKHPMQQGSRLLSFVEVREEIDRLVIEKGMDEDEAVFRISEIARGRLPDLLGEFGQIDFDAVREKGHLVKKVVHRKGQESAIEVYDALRALELIGRAHGLFKDKHEHTGELTIRTARDLSDDELANIATRGSTRITE